MYPFQRILIPTDFSLCAETAFYHALYLAERYTAEVHLLHVAPPQPALVQPNGVEAQTAAWPDRATKPPIDRPPYVERRHGLVLQRDVVRHSDPVTAILGYAWEHAVDLIVMGAHGDRGAGHFLSVGSAFLGHTAEQVVRHAQCPVFRTVMRNGSGPDKIRRLLVPVDGSMLSLLALTYARDFATFYDARLDLLRVLETRPPRVAEDLPEDESYEAHVQSAHDELVAGFEATGGAAVTASFHVTQGRPDREIRNFARRNATDLIVLGAHSDLGRDVLGNVAEQVVRTVSVPVLTARMTEPGLAPFDRNASASSQSLKK